MERLILHPTDTCQWYALVNEAQERSQLILCESTESYLVFLLMRFTSGAEWLDSLLAMDFFESAQYPGQLQLEKLKELGDKSLLFSGLFPGIAEKRRVSINYFVDMGQSAYFAVSQLEEDDSGLYVRLSEQFPSLQRILQAMRF